jgi:hypothetical protein
VTGGHSSNTVPCPAQAGRRTRVRHSSLGSWTTWRCSGAIAQYTRLERPHTASRRIFVRHVAPVDAPVTANGVRRTVREADRRACPMRAWSSMATNSVSQPAPSTTAVAAVSSNAVAGPHDPAELLRVDVQQIAWRLVLIALHRLDWPKITQLGQASPCKDTADGGFRHAHTACNLSLKHVRVPELDDEQGFARFHRARRPRRPGGSILQRRLTARQDPSQPLACRRRRHAVLCSGLAEAESLERHLADHFESTRVSESGHACGC